MAKELIAFYSRADENYVGGMLKMLETGNTEIAAGMIQELTGADVFHIEQEESYAKGYNECIAQAQEDLKSGARPKLREYPESLEAYDTIYLGFPNYWGTMPMAVFTFLEQYNMDGKRILPFCTHEGSGLGRSIEDIKKVCPGAKIGEAIAIRGGNVKHCKKEIEKWINNR